VLSTVAVLLTVALLIGWIWVIRENQSLTRAFDANRWLLAGGIISLAVVMCVVVLFSVNLVREILEGRRQQTFIDSVTHELKSPLASIKLCLDTLAREGLSPPQRQDLRHMMLTDVERLTVFVDDILEASRIAHGRRSQLWTVVDVPALLERAADNIRRRHNLGDDAIQIETSKGLQTTTDPTALETVLKNILDNAVKYSPAPPRVQVKLAPSDAGQLEITVTDQGIGVERNQLKRIFKRFYRSPDPQVYERSGTGLGLYVVQQLLRNIGGTVQVESAGANRGTTVSVRLPLGVSTTEASQS
jgi:signal transduction histidine kinase